MSRLGELTSEALRAIQAGARACVALVPVGSVEPHGPHLPLATDTLIGEAAAARAALLLAQRDVTAVIGPAIAYGVTDFARGFAGVVTIEADALTAYARGVVKGYLGAGFAHVCLVSNHLEPAHDAAVRAAVAGLPAGRASVASPLSPRWGRELSPEFRSGACHAGRYETSLVLAARPSLVDAVRARELPALPTSLSDAIKAGKTSFLAMGLDRAYTGAPADATAREGEELYAVLAEMIATEVLEGIATRKEAP